MKKINLYILLSILVSFSACKKDEDETPVVANGSVMFHMHSAADTTEIENYGDTIYLSSGRMMIVDLAKMYISNIRLVKADGSEVSPDVTKILQQQGTEEYELGSVPSGNYKTVKFDIGLSNADNASIPSASNAVLYQPSMWFGATAQPDGFVFVNLQGTIDTSSAMDGSGMHPFVYEIGTVANRVTVTLPDEPFTVSPNSEAMVHMEVNYAKIIEGLDLSDETNLNISTPSDNTGTAASTIVTNIEDMVEYE